MYALRFKLFVELVYSINVFLPVYAAPMGSISSMEVNVDVLEQMDLMDISDQEALDVFLNSGSGADEGTLASPLPGAQIYFFTGDNLSCCRKKQCNLKAIFKIVKISG